MQSQIGFGGTHVKHWSVQTQLSLYNAMSSLFLVSDSLLGEHVVTQARMVWRADR